MTKEAFTAQYEAIRAVILANMETLKQLLQTARNLADLIEKISGPSDSEIKKQLETQLDAVLESVDKLADQTMDLFNKYNLFVEETCK